MSEGTGDTGEPRIPRTEPEKPSTPVPSEGTDEQEIRQTQPAIPSTPTPGEDAFVGPHRASHVCAHSYRPPNHNSMLGALLLLWQVRTIIGWGALDLFLGGSTQPAVSWLERHRIKRSLGILLTYLGVVVMLLVILGIFVPVVIGEIRDLIDFVVTVTQSEEGATEFLRRRAEEFGVGGLFDRISTQLADLPAQLGELARSFLLSAGGVVVNAATVVSALVSILTLTFFLLLGRERLLNGTVQLFAEPQRPLVLRILQVGGKFGLNHRNLASLYVAYH